MRPTAPDGAHRVDHPAARQVKARRGHRRARGAMTDLRARGRHLARTRTSKDRPADPSPCGEPLVGGVDEHVGAHARDVVANDGERHGDLLLRP